MVSELQRIHSSMEIGEEFGIDEGLDENSGGAPSENEEFGMGSDEESV